MDRSDYTFQASMPPFTFRTSLKPFSRNNAYRMREVTEAIDNGRLPINRLPNRFSILYEAATRLITIHVPPPTAEDHERAMIDVGQDLVSLGVVACHDPGGVAPDPTLSYSFQAYARLSDAGRLPVRVHAFMPDAAAGAAMEHGNDCVNEIVRIKTMYNVAPDELQQESFREE